MRKSYLVGCTPAYHKKKGRLSTAPRNTSTIQLPSEGLYDPRVADGLRMPVAALTWEKKQRSKEAAHEWEQFYLAPGEKKSVAAIQ
jgi:hypothetical protein